VQKQSRLVSGFGKVSRQEFECLMARVRNENAGRPNVTVPIIKGVGFSGERVGDDSAKCRE
jgi:hypothetical protein